LGKKGRRVVSKGRKANEFLGKKKKSCQRRKKISTKFKGGWKPNHQNKKRSGQW